MPELPRIIVSSEDVRRLEDLLEKQDQSHPVVELLWEELNRAEVVRPENVPPTVVTMHSTVRFVAERSGKELELTLCYPREIDGAPGKVSILAPVGSALLGLAVGQTIDWPVPGGGNERYRIVDVVYQPERAGELHR